VGGDFLDFSQISVILQSLAVVSSLLIISYGGFVLVVSQNPNDRNEWKDIIGTVFFGLSVLFLAPLIGQALSGGNYCA